MRFLLYNFKGKLIKMQLNNFIEHTLLKPDAVQNEFIKLYDEAIKFNFFAVCVNGRNTVNAKEYLLNTNIKVVTVIGFPLGASTVQSKVFEAKDAIKNGADEIDMVMNLQAFKDNDFDYLKKDINSVKEACENKILKVIIETDLLSSDEIKKVCEFLKLTNADFVKTSTGFVKNGIGAKVQDVKIMSDVLQNSNIKIKASGGIKTKEQAAALINAGASRLGTSSGVLIMN